MIGERIVTGVLRRTCGPFWKTASSSPLHHPWVIPNTRAMSAFKMPSNLNSNRSARTTDMNLIARRFLHQHKSHQDRSSFTSAIVAFGAVLGLGSVIAYKSSDDDHTFMGVNVAHCAGGGDCGCEKNCKDKKCEDAPCLRGKECEEEKIMKANADLEKALKDIKGKAIEYTEAAMKAYCEAIEIMKKYINQAYCLIDNDELEPPTYEESWCCLYDISKKREEKVKAALEKGQCAWELLCRLRECIQAGRCCKFTSCNPLLKTAEEVLLCAENELLSLKQQMDCLGSEHDMVDQYADVIPSFKADMKYEVDNLPEEDKCCIQFCEQETAMIINQAYKKVVRMQKEMAQVLICQGKIPDRQKNTIC